MSTKASSVGAGRMVAERGSIRIVKFFTNWWALFFFGFLMIVLGITMIVFNWLEILCCFLANGYTVTGIGLGLIALGFLMPKTPVPASPLGKVIAALIFGIAAFVMVFAVGFGVN